DVGARGQQLRDPPLGDVPTAHDDHPSVGQAQA
ncbi:MAG: hypothetical protein JWN36_2674, partial [Microbacteriaceae bacterium]|nr:hypothetical protein [Microbacteriaceae bacterium]